MNFKKNSSRVELLNWTLTGFLLINMLCLGTAPFTAVLLFPWWWGQLDHWDIFCLFVCLFVCDIEVFQWRGFYCHDTIGFCNCIHSVHPSSIKALYLFLSVILSPWLLAPGGALRSNTSKSKSQLLSNLTFILESIPVWFYKQIWHCALCISALCQ